MLSHLNDSKRVGYRAGQDDGGKNWAEPADHEGKNPLAAEGLTVHLDLLLDFLHANDARDKQAGSNGRNRHHDRVGQEVEEVKELHSDDGHARQWAIAQAGQRTQRHHDDADKHRGFFAAPAQLILKGRDSALGQSNRACDRREQYEQEEQHADDCAQPHAGKHLGDGNEH